MPYEIDSSRPLFHIRKPRPIEFMQLAQDETAKLKARVGMIFPPLHLGYSYFHYIRGCPSHSSIPFFSGKNRYFDKIIEDKPTISTVSQRHRIICN